MPCGCEGGGRRALARAVEGAGGLLKAAVGIGIAADEIIQTRREACRACEAATRSNDPQFSGQRGLTTFSQCRECGCFIAAKTRLASEACPLGKWGAVESA